jgi:hypothetical protein
MILQFPSKRRTRRLTRPRLRPHVCSHFELPVVAHDRADARRRFDLMYRLARGVPLPPSAWVERL